MAAAVAADAAAVAVDTTFKYRKIFISQETGNKADRNEGLRCIKEWILIAD